MSGLVSTAGLWGADKAVALSGYTPHRHVPSSIEPGFAAPAPTSSLSFGPVALAAAVARTATTRDDAPIAVLDALQRSALPILETMIEDGATFGLSPNFQYLADTERTSLAARVGAGITDLYMNALGYTWRANAACLSSTLDPHADFIYEGGNASGHGVVLAEAHGSFAANASAKSVHLQSKNKYLRQVKPYLAMSSPYGKVIHGYSIAFGSKPSALGAFLSLSETKITKPRGKGAPPPSQVTDVRSEGSTPTSIALSAHRSNFFLMGGDDVVDWIDWVGTVDGAPPEPTPIEFLRLQYAGRHYLVHPSSLWWTDPPRAWLEDLFDHQHLWRHTLRWPPIGRVGRRPHLGWFAMEETAGTAFLKSLTGIIQDGGRSIPATLQLPSLGSIGFGLGGESAGRIRDDADYQYALFRDGLALLGDPNRGRLRGTTMWSPKEGVFPE